MTRRAGRNDDGHERDAPPWASDCTPEPGLAEALIALHRSEHAPERVVNRVIARLDALASVVPARHEGLPRRRLDGWRTNLAGAPAGLGLALVLALFLTLFLTWRQQLVDAPPQQADVVHDQPPAEEVLLTGTAVPGSLELRLFGDSDGMGQCEGQFLLSLAEVSPGEAERESPIRVRWTRCDLPDALSAELRRRLTPLAGAPPVSVSVWGRWQRAGEFEGRRLRVQP